MSATPYFSLLFSNILVLFNNENFSSLRSHRKISGSYKKTPMHIKKNFFDIDNMITTNLGGGATNVS